MLLGFLKNRAKYHVYGLWLYQIRLMIEEISWTIEKTLNILVPTCIKKRPPSKPIKQSIEGEGFLSGTKK